MRRTCGQPLDISKGGKAAEMQGETLQVDALETQTLEAQHEAQPWEALQAREQEQAEAAGAHQMRNRNSGNRCAGAGCTRR